MTFSTVFSSYFNSRSDSIELLKTLRNIFLPESSTDEKKSDSTKPCINFCGAGSYGTIGKSYQPPIALDNPCSVA